jgi:hypothetical protein
MPGTRPLVGVIFMPLDMPDLLEALQRPPGVAAVHENQAG